MTTGLTKVESEILEKAMKYARDFHEKVNQTYDGKPYFDTHVMDVYNIARRYIHLIPPDHRVIVLLAVLFHDVLEDCGVTYNDVKKVFYKLLLNEPAAIDAVEIVYAVTNFRGRTRSERAGAEYYKGIRETRYADFVKACDRLANVTASCTNGHAMSSGYAREHEHFRKEVFVDFKYSEIWYEMEELLLTMDEKELIRPGKLVTSNLKPEQIMVVCDIKILQTREDVRLGGEPEVILYCSHISGDCETKPTPIRVQHIRRFIGALL